MLPLEEIAKKYSTTSDKYAHRFDVPYTMLFEHRRHEPLTILEIGVKRGGSLRMWEDYFPHARIFGIDINVDCKQHESERTKVFVGDQSDKKFLKSVVTKVGLFDVVIDDGRHLPDHQVASMETLWPALNAGGVYVVEDLHAHAIRPKTYGTSGCAYPPLSDMILKYLTGLFKTYVVVATTPGVVCYNGLVALYKHSASQLINFEPKPPRRKPTRRRGRPQQVRRKKK